MKPDWSDDICDPLEVDTQYKTFVGDYIVFAKIMFTPFYRIASCKWTTNKCATDKNGFICMAVIFQKV